MNPKSPLNKVVAFLKEKPIWQKVVATLISTVILSIVAFVCCPSRDRHVSQSARLAGTDTADYSVEGMNIRIESGAILNITVIDYQDGITQNATSEVRSSFGKGRDRYRAGEYGEAIVEFFTCLELETDHERRGAINLQIGNCDYELRQYIRASDSYAEGLREARKGRDQHGEGACLASIANTYLMRAASSGRVRGENVTWAVERYNKALALFNKHDYPVQYATTQNNLGNAYAYLPAATPEQRAENVRNAIECYQAALEIHGKDDYPVEYATTQNNLGSAYADLPAATPGQRAENVRKAIECYQAALEITRKDEYPQDYCMTAANMGLALADTDASEACRWLKEAYSLRQFLPDRGKRLEEVMNKISID